MTAHDRAASANFLLSAIHRRYRRPLLSFFARRVRDRAEAEDLTQQVFLRLMSALRRADVKNAEAFLFTVASNLVRDYRRWSTRQNHSSTMSIDAQLVDTLSREVVEHRSPERVLIGRQDIEAVLSALDELGQRTKDIFLLFRLERMKHKDIAALYCISQSTVEKHVARAVLHLASRWRPD